MAQIDVVSPITAILEKAGRLHLTAEQQVQLRRLSLDFEAEAARLISERRLLEIRARRENVSKDTPLNFTSEQLAPIDEKTTKLRLAWLATLEKATAVLSPDQQGKIRHKISLLPSFESTPDKNGEDLQAQITRSVDAKLKDSRVIEVETAQAIADRLLGWGKLFTLAVGVPLTLGAIVLSFLGYHTYSDFTTTVSSAEQKALEQINGAAAKIAHEFEDRAGKLRVGYDKLEKQLVETQALPAKVQDLTNRLQRLEQIEIGGPNSVTLATRSALQKQIEEFRAYMERIGYEVPKGKITVIVSPLEQKNAYYDRNENRILIDPSHIDDPEIIYREYTARALAGVNAKAWDSGDIGKAIEFGLTDYMPCSYQGTTRFGAKYVQINAKIMPADEVRRGYIYDLANQTKFVSGDGAAPPWGGAFWEIRTLLGCQSTVAQCERADKILLAAWASSWSDGAPKTADRRFAQAIIAAVGSSGSPEEIEKIRSVFERRGLELTP
jgi:hypothetical protein